MPTSSRNPSVDSAGSNPERILRGSRTQAEITTPLHDQDMEDHFSVVRVTDLVQIQDAQFPQEVAWDTPEE